MTFVSFFAGIGGIDLFVEAIPGVEVECDAPRTHEHNGDLLKLDVPDCMRLPKGDNQIVWHVVVFVEVNMVDYFVRPKLSTTSTRCNYDMLCHIPTIVGVRVIWNPEVVISISETCSLSALACGFSLEDAAAFPRGVGFSHLIAFGGLACWYPHFMQGPPHDLLCGAVLGGDFDLRHSQRYVIAIELGFGERNGVCVLVAHAGIIPNSSRRVHYAA